MKPEDIFTSLQSLIADLIGAGICIDQNFPVFERLGRANEIHFGKTVDLSITLKNIPYDEAYQVLRRNRAFSLCLIDGAIIQVLYKFLDGKITRHKLAFFPSPDLLEYQNNSEIYELDELYGDVVDRNIVTVPLRFDFDPSAGVDYEHPVSHLTIGQYKNCRIPVSAAVSPFIFLNFLLRSFYNTPFRKFCSEITGDAAAFEETITVRERQHMHLHVGC